MLHVSHRKPRVNDHAIHRSQLSFHIKGYTELAKLFHIWPSFSSNGQPQGLTRQSAVNTGVTGIIVCSEKINKKTPLWTLPTLYVQSVSARGEGADFKENIRHERRSIFRNVFKRDLSFEKIEPNLKGDDKHTKAPGIQSGKCKDKTLCGWKLWKISP